MCLCAFSSSIRLLCWFYNDAVIVTILIIQGKRRLGEYGIERWEKAVKKTCQSAKPGRGLAVQLQWHSHTHLQWSLGFLDRSLCVVWLLTKTTRLTVKYASKLIILFRNCAKSWHVLYSTAGRVLISTYIYRDIILHYMYLIYLCML